MFCDWLVIELVFLSFFVAFALLFFSCYWPSLFLLAPRQKNNDYLVLAVIFFLGKFDLHNNRSAGVRPFSRAIFSFQQFSDISIRHNKMPKGNHEQRLYDVKILFNPMWEKQQSDVFLFKKKQANINQFKIYAS